MSLSVGAEPRPTQILNTHSCQGPGILFRAQFSGRRLTLVPILANPPCTSFALLRGCKWWQARRLRWGKSRLKAYNIQFLTVCRRPSHPWEILYPPRLIRSTFMRSSLRSVPPHWPPCNPHPSSLAHHSHEPSTRREIGNMGIPYMAVWCHVGIADDRVDVT